MGSVNINNTGGGADVTISSDGTSLLLNGTAVGGGAETVEIKPDAYTVTTADLGKIIVFTGSFNEYGTLSTTADLGAGFYVTIVNQSGSRHTVNRTGTTDKFFPNNSDGQTQLILASGASITLVSDGTSKWLPKNQSYYLYTEGNNNSGNFKPVASGTGAVALGRGANAGGNPSFAAGTNSAFSGSTADGAGSTALGGSYASGTDSFAAAIANNTSSYGATGANSVALGYQAKASGAFTTSIGYGTQATSGNAMSFGRSSLATGSLSLALGYQANASAERSVAIGSNAKAEIKGKLAYAAYDFGSSAIYSQTGIYTLLSDTTDATPEALTTNKSAASTDNQIILPNNSAFSFSGNIVARQQVSGGSEYASWEVKGTLLRDGSAASTVLGNGIVDKIYSSAGASSWIIALSADTTNGGLAITVTGPAATNIRWVATLNTSEVTYA
jgi:hypothetical protein